MKTLKLEVGKTCRSRNGKEVKIIGMNRESGYQFKGSDGEWYAESGRFAYTTETPHDLIEEVEAPPATRHTFDIPNGVKKVTVEQVGNRIVVEMVPEEVGQKPEVLKEGDIVFEDGRIMIVKMHPNFHHAIFYPNYDSLYINDQYGIPFTSAAFRLATTKEAQLLFDALKKAGKRWNAETMEVEEVTEYTRIREWMDMNIKCGGEVVDIAEVIERYLKYREGEK